MSTAKTTGRAGPWDVANWDGVVEGPEEWAGSDGDTWGGRLGCCVVALAYDFATRTGRIDFPPYNCCDMRACVALFRGIDRNVKAINTYAGGKPDTMYRRKGNDWNAYMPRVVNLIERGNPADENRAVLDLGRGPAGGLADGAGPLLRR